jgi:outer membrane protein assembly factor BamB
MWSGPAAPSYAAAAVVNGVVLDGALDGTFKAFDATSGQVLWAQPLLGPISSGAAVVGDSVYVGSGTSSSDACQKGVPVVSDACVAAFNEVLGSTGGISAFHLAGS